MKKILIIMVCALLYVMQGRAQNVDQQLNALISAGDYLELNQQYTLHKDSVSPFMRAIVKPLLSSAFNKDEQAAGEIDNLLNTYGTQLGSSALNFIAMLGQQLYYIGEYKAAANLLNNTLQSLRNQQAPKETIAPLEEIYKKVQALKDVGKPSVTRLTGKSSQIKLLQNLKASKHGWYIPVTVNGKDEPFLLDTGAGMNVVSASFAKQHGVRTVLASIPVAGSGNVGFMQLGVIDSLTVGNVVYRNAVVGIAKDDQLLPQHVQDSIGYRLDAILGIDFIKAIGGLTVYPKKGTIELSAFAEPGSKQWPNIMLVGNAPYVACAVNGVRLLLNCDTGMGMEGYITFDAYNKHKERFKGAKVPTKNVRIGGFVSAEEYETLQLEKAIISLSGSSKQINNLNILKKNSPYDGALGVGFLRHLEKVVFDLTNMQLAVY